MWRYQNPGFDPHPLLRAARRFCKAAIENKPQNPSHWLGLWQKKDSNNIWVRYTEGLTRAILTNENIRLDPEGLARKLRSRTDCVSTLAEMESAIFLAEKGFAVTLEPTAPLKGPDLRADWDSVPYFVEVRTVGFSGRRRSQGFGHE
jgi:hypothetical protein